MTQRKIVFRCGKLTKYAMGVVNHDMEYGHSVKEIAIKLGVHPSYIEEFLLR